MAWMSSADSWSQPFLISTSQTPTHYSLIFWGTLPSSQNLIHCLISTGALTCLLLGPREKRLFIVIFQAPSTVLGTSEVLREGSGGWQTGQQTAAGSCCSPPASLVLAAALCQDQDGSRYQEGTEKLLRLLSPTGQGHCNHPRC